MWGVARRPRTPGKKSPHTWLDKRMVLRSLSRYNSWLSRIFGFPHKQSRSFDGSEYMDETHQRNASIPTASVSEPSPFISSQRKRILPSSPAISVTEATENRRKAPKVSRACDLCKIKKAKCTGTRPCSNCTRKNLPCVYYAEYRRGRPPTPPPGASEHMAERRGSVINRM